MALDGKGTKKATVDPTFRGAAEALKADAGNLAQAARGQAQRKWQVGPLQGWGGDPLDIEGMSDRFDRELIGQQYAACLSDPNTAGTVADTRALTLQSDWLCVQERAFRLRHATSVRCAIHAAGRRKGHSHEKGIFQTGTVKYIEDIIKRGAS